MKAQTYRKPKDRVAVSTWPFADGYPWDEELIRNGSRALSTHGPVLNPLEGCNITVSDPQPIDAERLIELMAMTA